MYTLRFKQTLLTIALMLLIQAISIAKSDYTKKIHQSWSPEEVEALMVQNKFGNITISEMAGDSVVVDVLLTITNSQEKKARYLLDQINIDIHKSGNTIKAITSFENNFKTRENFSIDYYIAIPKECSFDIVNRYGKVFFGELAGDTKLSVGYGGIFGDKISCPDLSLKLEYSKAEIKSTQNIDLELRYSKIYLDSAANIISESKYSTVSSKFVNSVVSQSKYDNYIFGEIFELKHDAKYTRTKIKHLHGLLQLTNGYGSFTAERVSDVQKISIDNSYASINLGVDNRSSYKLKANAAYARIHYPRNEELNVNKDHSNMAIWGTVGDNSTDATITINTRYGSVSLLPY